VKAAFLLQGKVDKLNSKLVLLEEGADEAVKDLLQERRLSRNLKLPKNLPKDTVPYLLEKRHEVYRIHGFH
jgi:hypothetical protein